MNKMLRMIVPLAMVALAGVAVFQVVAPQTRSKRVGATGEIFSSTDLPAALREAGAASPPGLVVADFTASWCGPCQKMKNDSWPDPRVAALFKAGATGVLVDVDAHPAVAAQQKVSSIPLIVAFRGSKEVARSVGYLGPDELLKFLESAKAR